MIYTNANLGDWGIKCKKALRAVLKQSVNDVVIDASKTATGVMRGGALVKGFVPRDTGALAASLVSTLHGSTAITQAGGEFSLVVGGIEAGDMAEFTWTAPYARALHYGKNGVDGWHWVTEATNNWQDIVDKNVARAK
jgi:hypothetical protein